MLSGIHFFPGLLLLALGVAVEVPIVRWLLERSSKRLLIRLFAVGAAAVMLLGYLLEFQTVMSHFPVWWATWIDCAGLMVVMGMLAVYVAMLVPRAVPGFRPQRRAFLKTASAGLCLAPVAGTVFGIVSRNQFKLSEVVVPIPNLPRDLEGLRIVQITDIHLSPFLSEKEFARAIDMANESRANIALVTGDLISASRRSSGRLPAPIGSPARRSGGARMSRQSRDLRLTENYVTEQGRRIGIEFLRDQARLLRFGDAPIEYRRRGLSENANSSI